MTDTQRAESNAKVHPVHYEKDAAERVAQLSVAEKAALCSGQDFWFLEGLPQHDVPSIMVTDGPHGLRKQEGAGDHINLSQSVPATCFPTASALASSWDAGLLREIGVALAEECLAERVSVLLGPGLNIKRHPLCGRNFEYFSEDPLLGGKLAAALIGGVQSLGVGTSLKHFAANNQERGRMVVDTLVDERTLREIYLRGFEIAVREAQPWTVMCAYPRLGGVYCSENEWLLNQVLREEWGFKGLVVTDWGAANDRVAGVRAGLDLEMPASGGENDRRVAAAVQSGALEMEALDRVVTRNLALSLCAKEKLASSRSPEHEAHHALARRAATESAVLLRNENDILPLTPERTVAVIGAFAKSPRYQGAGSSFVNPTHLGNAYDAIASLVGEAGAVRYAAGYEPERSQPDAALIEEAVVSARQAEQVIVFAGLPAADESEAMDRTHLGLPQQHQDLIRAICAVHPNTVVVLSNGAPVEMPWRMKRPRSWRRTWRVKPAAPQSQTFFSG